jgi:type VI secretion system secreted protein VgrG
MEKHHSKRETGKSYIVTSVRHFMDGSNQYTTGGSQASEGYENDFTCIPAEAPLRPMQESPRPRVQGPQTAVVVGPAGEEIYTDEHGRVKVQFHWDREGQKNENSSCWMRVSQVHAGQGWGMMDLPRIGEEVIVSFLEGDPDRPIITGRVYNGQNMPPFALPAGKTRRGNMTKTYKGAGFNEMSMDDTPGKEQLRVNAQYDMNSNVNHDQTLDVGNNQTEKVAVDRTREVGNNETVTVGVNKSVKVGTNHDETIGSNQSINVGVMKNEMVGVMSNEVVGVAKTTSVGVGYALTVGAAKNEAVGFISAEQVGLNKTVLVGNNQAHTVGNQCSLDVGTDLKITAGSKIEIACGGCSIVMDSGGKMTISASSECVINGGGATIVMKSGIIDLN